MEAAPLTQAWQHAKEASIATANSDTTAALMSHAQAAGEFAKAAATTSSNEAIRTLRLLENHHRKLGELLQFPKSSLVPDATAKERLDDNEVKAEEEKPVSTSAAVAELRAKSQNATPQLQKGQSPASRRTTSTFPRRLPPREMSSSIASNLASARGIRSTSQQLRALSPSINPDNAPGTIGPPSRRRPNAPNSPSAGGRPSWLPPTENEATISRRISRDDSTRVSRRNSRDHAESVLGGSSRDHARTEQTTIAEEGFLKFYSAFESLKSKLSAPLAFAGLPLISEEGYTAITPASSTPSTTARSAGAKGGRERGATSAPQEPDLTRYFSRAAIKASLTTSQAAVNDSFYVVPTSGGTVSYAQMVGYTGENGENRHEGEIIDNDEDEGEDEGEFVDAREYPVTITPRRGSFAGSFGRALGKGEMVDKKVGLSRKSSAAGSQANQLEELTEKNRFLENAVVEMRDALAKEKHKLRVYQGQSQAGTLAIQNMLESGVLPRSTGSSIHQSIHASMMQAKPGGWTEQPLTAGGQGVDVEMLRKEIQDLRAEVGKEKRSRRKLESDALKESVAREREREVAAKEIEKMRTEMEAYKGEAMKLRMLEKSAREKAEKRRKEGRAGKGGSKDASKEGGSDDTGSRASDAARFVSG